MRRMSLRWALTAAVVLAAAGAARAGLRAGNVEYKHGDVTLEGYLAYDDAMEGQRPGVVVVHEWYGVNDYVKGRARQLARLGYVALAIDMYGKGRRAKTRAEAARLSGALRKDRKLMRARARAGLEALKRHRLTNRARLAAIGFCFGGTTALELARGGADLDVVVSFHGGLGTPLPAKAGEIKAKVLVLHGAADPHVTAEEVAAFRKEMTAAKADWQMISYGGAVHAFTNPDAGNDPSTGAAYDAKAARRSWAAMQLLFIETIGLPDPDTDEEGIGRFIKEKIFRPVGKAGKATGKAVGKAGKATGKAVKKVWDKLTGNDDLN